MSINTPASFYDNQYPEIIDQYHPISVQYTPGDNTSHEEKQRMWAEPFNDYRSCYYLNHGPFNLANFKRKHAHIETGDNFEQFIPGIVMMCWDYKTLNDIFETTPEEQERIFGYLSTYAEKHGKQQEIEQFIYYTIIDNRRYRLPLTQRQENFLLAYIQKHGKEQEFQSFFYDAMLDQKYYHRPLSEDESIILRGYAKKYERQQEYEEFLHNTTHNIKPLPIPLTWRQKNQLHGKVDINYIPLSEDEKQKYWNEEFLVMMNNDAGVDVFMDNPGEKCLPVPYGKHVHLYSIMEQNFIRFIPGILRHLEDNGYKKEIEEIFSFTSEEQHLPARIRVGIELQKIGQHMKDNLKKETE